MPMGGLGSRFTQAGYTTPKPLIEVDGIPMFMKALQSFSPLENVRYIFVIRNDQNIQYNLKEAIQETLPSAIVHIVYQDTRGAVETCLIAEESIDTDLPIAIADCDIYFESDTYFNKIGNKDIDGMLLTFHSNDPRYSYVETDSSGKVIRTAEKVVISNNAILGGYYFKSGKLFKELARSFTDSELPEHLKEYYLSHLFNLLIENGGNIEIASIDTMHIFGTPEELSAYLNRRKDGV